MDDYDDAWYPEEPGQVRYGFCGQYSELHEPHVYVALNAWALECPGWDAEDEAYAVAEAARPPCEHGLSASLCAGPSHYPMDM